MDDYTITDKELAERWNLHLKTIQKWRRRGKGPKFIKLGIAVRYRISDIVKYEEEKLNGKN